ncbi:photosystem I assembly protein Ycf3 [Nodularia spumigena CCY9414]|nr:photosystem I assembly protein Ycf3 [Nodularia spumigena CCY9414]
MVPQSLIFFLLVNSQEKHTPPNPHLAPLLAPPEIPPQRGEEKDKPLIWEGQGVGLLPSSLAPEGQGVGFFLITQPTNI